MFRRSHPNHLDRQPDRVFPDRLYCDNCHAEIHVGQDHRKSFRNVICKCRWQLVHMRELPRNSFQWELFWRPWRSEPEPGG